MLRGLRRLAVVAGEGTVNVVKERKLLQTQHLPGAFKAAQIDGSQIRILSVAKQGRIAEKGQLIVPRDNRVRGKGEFLPNRISVIPPGEQLLQAILEFLVTG